MFFLNMLTFNMNRITNHSNSYILINREKLLPSRRLVGKKGRERETQIETEKNL